MGFLVELGSFISPLLRHRLGYINPYEHGFKDRPIWPWINQIGLGSPGIDPSDQADPRPGIGQSFMESAWDRPIFDWIGSGSPTDPEILIHAYEIAPKWIYIV